MKVNGVHYRTVWLSEDDSSIVKVIDQRLLPYKFLVEDLRTVEDVTRAIKNMQVRGAGLIGATAGYGMYLAALEAPKNKFDEFLMQSGEKLKSTRPTSINLALAVEKQINAINNATGLEEKINAALRTAKEIADEDAEYCRRIGENGLDVIRKISERKNSEIVNILTHCNAGWLAFVDYGSALSPVYAAFDAGINVHVWVDETRPRNQGSKLTAWELLNHGVPHHIITDNAGGHLMQHGMVDLCLVGTDRTTYTGDVANKIGTYLKALSAKDNNVSFYVALPSSSFDWNIKDGIKGIPIEERSPEEVAYMEGLNKENIERVLVAPARSPVSNYGFDVTPARLITGLITERGICKASEEGIKNLFPEKFVR